MYIKSSSANLTKSFMIREMYACQCMILKEIHIIFVSMIICSIVDYLITAYTWRKRSKYYSILIQKCFSWKENSIYWKFKDKIFKLFYAPELLCYCPAEFLLPKTSPLSEWSIDITAAFYWNQGSDTCGIQIILLNTVLS